MSKKKADKKKASKPSRRAPAPKGSSLGTCHSSDGQEWIVIVTTDGEVRADRID